MNEYLARVYVTLKPGVNDPQGTTIKENVNRLGLASIRDIRLGKYLEIVVDATNLNNATKTVEELCDKVLANPVIEQFSHDITLIEE